MGSDQLARAMVDGDEDKGAAFDTNGDSRLTAADSGFSKFKVLVTNADGSQTARTLTELGIREIGLLGDATHITLPDGSVITGQSTFTRTNGTTGTVADVVLVADAEGRRVVQTITTDAAGTRTVVSQAFDADGSLASAITSVTSRDGFAITNSDDDDGDGIFDRIQTINTVVATDGARSETLVNDVGNSLASAAVVNRTVTDTARPGTLSSKFPWRHEGCKRLPRRSGGVRAFLP